MRANEIVRLLENDGRTSTGQPGGHRLFRHPSKEGLIVVPMHSGKEMGKGLVHSILRKAGLK